MATWIVGLIVLVAVYFAARYVFKVEKSGGCVGCSASSKGCCHCTELKKISKQIKE